MNKQLLIALVALLVAACVPIPHKAFRTPYIFGQIQGDSKILANVRVRAVAAPEGESCRGSHMIEGAIDDSGFFLVCPDPDFQFTSTVMAHTTFEWNACIFHENQWQLVHQGQQYTLGDLGPRAFVELTCAIDESSVRCDEEIHPAYAGSPIPWETIEPFGCKWVEPSTE